MTPEAIAEIQKTQADNKAFRETVLGGLFMAFENKHGRAWQTDSRESATTASMDRDWAASDAARAAFVSAIKENQSKAELGLEALSALKALVIGREMFVSHDMWPEVKAAFAVIAKDQYAAA